MLVFAAVLSVYKRTTHHVPLRVVDRHVTTPRVITAILSEQPFAARSRETVPICWDSEAQFENAFRNWGKTGGRASIISRAPGTARHPASRNKAPFPPPNISGFDDGAQRVAVIRIAGQRPGMQNKLATRCPGIGGDDGSF